MSLSITGVVGYPRRGFDDEHCDVRIVMVLDKDKTELGDGSPFVGIKVDVGYIIGVKQNADTCYKWWGTNRNINNNSSSLIQLHEHN